MSTSHDLSDPEAQTVETGAPSRWVPNSAIHKNSEKKKAHKDAFLRKFINAEYGDSSATYWTLYMSEAEICDQKFIETLTTDTTAISILNGIFSAIVASFIVQTSQSLQPNNSQATVCLLSQLVFPENSTQQSPFCPGSYPGEPSMAAIRSNILLLISFFLSMMTVLACAFVQQLCSEYMKCAYPRAAPHRRGRVRTYLFKGLNRFYIRQFMYGVHVILHISVVLFFCGISDYLHDAYPRVGMVSWYCVSSLVAVYATLSVFPLFIGNSPYQTVLSPPLLFGSTLLLFFCRTALGKLRVGDLPQKEERYFDKTHYLVKKATANAPQDLDPYALNWLFTEGGFSDTDLDKFLEDLPRFIRSRFTFTEGLSEVLTEPFILQRIRAHLLTCVTSTGLSEQAWIKRVSTCIESLRIIFQLNNSDNESLRACLQDIVEDLRFVCDKPTAFKDLRAFCVRALVFQGILTKWLEPTRAGSPNKVPSYFLPMFTVFSSIINPRQAPMEVTDEDTKWRVLLHDGPFINLTLLAKAILSPDHLDADPTSLSTCWKTLDILRSGLQSIRTDISCFSLALFEEIHGKTRSRVKSEGLGSSVFPLLEILDVVDGGRRLSMVFQDHPRYSKLVFGKDRLRNLDLFHAFANCLPQFVTDHPARVAKAFMEDLVLRDHLWISLQVHLLNSLRPDSFTPAIIHVFETCCTVIDTAFVALEGSEKVDLRTPEFGSLAHYFEIYVTDCFRGMFIERSIGFRVGLIKARLCNAILAQFLDEFDRKRTVVFRSHWDVASLARAFYSLGVGNEENVEFWKLHVDGGSIGEELMANTYATLKVAERDGPLLNFCRLVHLGMMAVPFEGSGLQETDFEKLLHLMQKMAEDSPLPLIHASTSVTVWEELHRLTDEVAGIYESYSEDRPHMAALWVKINEVLLRCPLSSHEHLPIDGMQAQASGTSAIVQPNPPSRGRLIPEIEADSGDATSARPTNALGGFANVYRNPYPHLPSQIDQSGTITRPYSASFLPNLLPHLGGTEVASLGVPSAHPSLSHLRFNSQHRHSSVYYPPRGDATTNWAPATLSSLSPESDILSGPSSGDVA